MAYIRDGIRENLILSEATHLLGQVEGDIKVLPNVNLQIHGVVLGDIILEPGAEVYVHGRVIGDITNNGGRLSVFGQVVGKIIQNKGETLIDPKAQIRDFVSNEG